MRKSILGYILCFFIFYMMISCEGDTCPEGSVPIEDANGNIIDCFTPPNFGVEYHKLTSIQD